MDVSATNGGSHHNSSTPPLTPPRITSVDHIHRAYAALINYSTMINRMARDDYDSGDDDELEHNHVQESNCTPASKSFVNSLVPIKLTDAILKGLSTTTSTSCSICTDELKLEEKVYKLPAPCYHWFHCHCILPWLRRKNTCPLCRHEFPSTRENERLPAVADQSLTDVRVRMFRPRYRRSLRITHRTFV